MNRGYVYAIVSAFLLTASIVINKYLLEFVNPRMLSFVFFFMVFISSSALITYRSRKGFLSNIARNWKDGIIVGGFNALAATFFFMALNLLDASTTAFLVRFSTIFIIIIGVFHLKETLTFLDIAGIITAVIGAVVINYSGASFTGMGLFVAIMAALFIALHQTTAKMFVKKVHPLNLVSLRTLFSSTFLFVIALATSSIQLVPQGTFVWFVAGGMLASVGFLFFYKSLEMIAVSKAAVIRTLDPFIVVVYGIFFFRIFPSVQEMIGGTLIILGVIIIIMKHRLNKLPMFFRKPTWFW